MLCGKRRLLIMDTVKSRLVHIFCCIGVLITASCSNKALETVTPATGPSQAGFVSCGASLNVSVSTASSMNQVTAGVPVTFQVNISGGSGNYVYGANGAAPNKPISASGSITDAFTAVGFLASEKITVQDLVCSGLSGSGVSSSFTVVSAGPSPSPSPTGSAPTCTLIISNTTVKTGPTVLSGTLSATNATYFTLPDSSQGTFSNPANLSVIFDVQMAYIKDEQTAAASVSDTFGHSANCSTKYNATPALILANGSRGSFKYSDGFLTPVDGISVVTGSGADYTFGWFYDFTAQYNVAFVSGPKVSRARYCAADEVVVGWPGSSDLATLNTVICQQVGPHIVLVAGGTNSTSNWTYGTQVQCPTGQVLVGNDSDPGKSYSVKCATAAWQ